ncbi:glycerol kinase GlpK [Acetobacterium carbinolicum]|jgi:glycerol kinase|uniref:glycerol kinase GlpK n=1 Tax=Acetobacterium TaxID=33951 RepID=UPI000DBEB7F1|nr:glycerol kinase GlpK [Acetobacterium sp. KB-1]AWW28165.1 glycerol kinase [Acetobacterium sp. KB-1]
MKEYILSIDQGTTSIRAIFFNHDGDIVSVYAKEFAQFYPDSGWVEQDPMEMWAVTGEVIEKAMAKSNINEDEIVAIGITNQRETSIVWDKNTGEPVYNAIVWQDRRTAEYCDQLKAEDPEIEAKVRNKTGLMIDSYFSGTKVKWILDNVEGARERAEKGDLLFGNVDTWIMWKLTGGKTHATDYSNASRTLMYNIHDLKWDEELLEVFNVPASMLPKVQESSGHFGVTAKIFKRAIPITGDAGDQQAATFGQCCFKKGMAKFTYGTAGVMTVNIGDKPFLSNNGLTTTIGWGINGKVEYLLEAVAFSAGSAIQWLRDEMDMLDESPDSEYFALKTKKVSNCGVYFVPAFTGLCAPYWNSYARAAIVGIERGTTKNNIIRAVLESLGYQTRDMFDAFSEDLGERLSILKVDGGACNNNLLMQFTSDIVNVDIERPDNTETTAAGVAYLAGLAVGFWKDQDEIVRKRTVNQVFHPQMDEELRNELYRGWKRAINCNLEWANDR